MTVKLFFMYSHFEFLEHSVLYALVWTAWSFIVVEAGFYIVSRMWSRNTLN